MSSITLLLEMMNIVLLYSLTSSTFPSKIHIMVCVENLYCEQEKNEEMWKMGELLFNKTENILMTAHLCLVPLTDVQLTSIG